MKHRRFLCAILLISALLLSAISAGAQDYSALFDRTNWDDLSAWSAQLSDSFLASPVTFVQELTKEEYGHQYTVLSTLVHENDVDHTATITALTNDSTLNQSERRIVQWLVGMLKVKTGNAPQYSWLQAPVDYAEVFSHHDKVDGFAADMFGSELFEVFCQDGNQFIENLARQEDEAKEHLTHLTIYGAYGPCTYIEIMEMLDDLYTDTLDSAQMQVVVQLKAATDKMHPDMDPTESTAPTEVTTVPESSATEPTVPAAPLTPETKPKTGYYIAGAAILLLAAAVVLLLAQKRK